MSQISVAGTIGNKGFAIQDIPQGKTRGYSVIVLGNVFDAKNIGSQDIPKEAIIYVKGVVEDTLQVSIGVGLIKKSVSDVVSSAYTLVRTLCVEGTEKPDVIGLKAPPQGSAQDSDLSGDDITETSATYVEKHSFTITPEGNNCVKITECHIGIKAGVGATSYTKFTGESENKSKVTLAELSWNTTACTQKTKTSGIDEFFPAGEPVTIKIYAKTTSGIMYAGTSYCSGQDNKIVYSEGGGDLKYKVLSRIVEDGIEETETSEATLSAGSTVRLEYSVRVLDLLVYLKSNITIDVPYTVETLIQQLLF